MLKAATQLFSGSLFGKLAGIIREILLASLFGTSGIVAAVRAAQAATLVPVNFFTADILSAGFLPLYCRYTITDQARANSLFIFVSALLFVASVIVVCLLSLGAHLWVGVLVPGFGPLERAYTVEFIDVFAVGVPFYIAGNLLSYREMGHELYVMTSARATLQSIGMILGTVGAFYFHMPILLAWGFTAAYIGYCVWGFQRMFKRHDHSFPNELSRVAIREIAKDFWSVVKPLVLLPAFLQTNIVAERAVASLLGVNVAASVDYAKLITDTGVLLFAVPLGLASLSVVSRMTDQQTRELLMRVMPGLLLFSVPVSAALAAHSHLIITIIYQRGAFGTASTELTKTLLWSFAIGFWAQIISYVLLKTLSAKLRNREVFRLMAFALASNVLINVAFYRVLGPVVLGLGSCSYALVLTVGAARALGVLQRLTLRAIVLLFGAVGYSLLAMRLPHSDVWSLIPAAALFCVYWGSMVALVPFLRRDALTLLSGLRNRNVTA